MPQEPTIGRIVHYVLDDVMDEHRPAIIARVFSPVMVNLQVFVDGQNDSGLVQVGSLLWKSSVEHDEEFKATGTWHWPERES